MAWIDKDGNVRYNNTDFMYGKFGDTIKDVKVNELDGTIMYGDDHGNDTILSDDGMEGRLKEILIISRAKCVAYNMLNYNPMFESGYNMLFSEVWKCLNEE